MFVDKSRTFSALLNFLWPLFQVWIKGFFFFFFFRLFIVLSRQESSLEMWEHN